MEQKTLERMTTLWHLLYDYSNSEGLIRDYRKEYHKVLNDPNCDMTESKKDECLTDLEQTRSKYLSEMWLFTEFLQEYIVTLEREMPAYLNARENACSEHIGPTWYGRHVICQKEGMYCSAPKCEFTRFCDFMHYIGDNAKRVFSEFEREKEIHSSKTLANYVKEIEEKITKTSAFFEKASEFEKYKNEKKPVEQDLPGTIYLDF